MFLIEFGRAKMAYIVENLSEDGERAILEWSGPTGLLGCGFFHVRNDRIIFQRGYPDQLSFFGAQGIPVPADYPGAWQFLESKMKRVTGIGGIFFKSQDPERLGAWYRDHLGLDVTEWGGAIFQWGGPDSAPGMTIWSPFGQDTRKMEPSSASFMINFRVADLGALLAALRSEGCEVIDNTEPSEYGKFAWVIDPEGNKIELWEPPAGQ